MEQIMYINVCIPMLITHVKNNRELKGKKEPRQSRVCMWGNLISSEILMYDQ
jgi:hypothetical protein